MTYQSSYFYMETVSDSINNIFSNQKYQNLSRIMNNLMYVKGPKENPKTHFTMTFWYNHDNGYNQVYQKEQYNMILHPAEQQEQEWH